MLRQRNTHQHGGSAHHDVLFSREVLLLLLFVEYKIYLPYAVLLDEGCQFQAGGRIRAQPSRLQHTRAYAQQQREYLRKRTKLLLREPAKPSRAAAAASARVLIKSSSDAPAPKQDIWHEDVGRLKPDVVLFRLLAVWHACGKKVGFFPLSLRTTSTSSETSAAAQNPDFILHFLFSFFRQDRVHFSVTLL